MKFTPKLDFKHGHAQNHFRFEQGNTYTADKYGLSDAQVEEFYRVGWVDIEGRDPGPAPTPGAQRIHVHDSLHVAGGAAPVVTTKEG